MSFDFDVASRLTIAALSGAAIGLEREWSGHATGPRARFAGLRSLLLLGIVSGCAGILATRGFVAGAAVIAAGCVALPVIGYLMAVHTRDASLDGTTEVSALAVVALAVLAGIGLPGVAAGATAIAVLALTEKDRLHRIVRHVSERELRAAMEFVVLALIVLPLLPEGPYWGMIAFRPRTLWIVVLAFSGLNFVGFIARRVIGPDRGYALSGLLGGMFSSTGVAVSFSRLSRDTPAHGVALGRGVLAASAVMCLRVVILSTVLSPAVGRALLPLLAPGITVTAGAVIALWNRGREEGTADAHGETENPLRLSSAIRLAVALQFTMILLTYVRTNVGVAGLYASGALVGLGDMDALTYSFSRADAQLTATVAARVIAVGAIANTMVKAGIGALLGSTSLKRIVVPVLVGTAVMFALALWVF